ncbi:MAG: nucleotide exchange factor GrpE [Rhodomicrobiaceae bacterium]
MDEEKRGPSDSADETANSASSAEGNAETHMNAGNGASEEVVARLNSEIESLRAENQQLQDKTLRLVSDMENLRRRTERDKSEFSKYAISEFARDILGVADNIRRAIEAVPENAVSSDPVLGSLVEGVQVTEKELLKALEKYQVKRFDPKGEPFNPHKHDAMTRIEVPNVPADTVVQVIHAGYMIAERVLRPAAVIVAKEPTTTDSSSGSSQDDADEEDEVIPPGAMKVPEPMDSAREAPAERPVPRNVRVDVQTNVLGKDFQAERRRQNSAQSGDDRVAHLRRPRSPAGDQSFSEVRTSSSGAAPNTKPSALHKPVISRKD